MSDKHEKNEAENSDINKSALGKERMENLAAVAFNAQTQVEQIYANASLEKQIAFYQKAMLY